MKREPIEYRLTSSLGIRLHKWKSNFNVDICKQRQVVSEATYNEFTSKLVHYYVIFALKNLIVVYELPSKNSKLIFVL